MGLGGSGSGCVGLLLAWAVVCVIGGGDGGTGDLESKRDLFKEQCSIPSMN